MKGFCSKKKRKRKKKEVEKSGRPKKTAANLVAISKEEKEEE
jgi:hypothetical protein